MDGMCEHFGIEKVQFGIKAVCNYPNKDELGEQLAEEFKEFSTLFNSSWCKNCPKNTRNVGR